MIELGNEAGDHYKKYVIQEADVGESLSLEFLTDKWNLEPFQAEIIRLIIPSGYWHACGEFYPTDVGQELDPFFIDNKLSMGLFAGTVIKKTYRLGSALKSRDEDLKGIISAIKRKSELASGFWVADAVIKLCMDELNHE